MCTSIHGRPIFSWSSRYRSNTITTRTILGNYGPTSQRLWRLCCSALGGFGQPRPYKTLQLWVGPHPHRQETIIFCNLNCFHSISIFCIFDNIFFLQFKFCFIVKFMEQCVVFKRKNNVSFVVFFGSMNKYSAMFNFDFLEIKDSIF
jgi:hypothetical protein